MARDVPVRDVEHFRKGPECAFSGCHRLKWIGTPFGPLCEQHWLAWKERSEQRT